MRDAQVAVYDVDIK